MGTYEYAFIALKDSPYREDIAHAFADIVDIGVNTCGYSGQEIMDAFVVSGLARNFELQNPVYVAGKSGSELLDYLMPCLGGKTPVRAQHRFDRTPEYWLGWILGHYQVETGLPYARILQTIRYDELIDLYYPLHEAPETKAFEVLERRLRRDPQPTRLRTQRDAAQLSQAELAQRSQVGLRSIQMYEQRNKDINKAQAATLIRLSRILHCNVEDLLEVG